MSHARSMHDIHTRAAFDDDATQRAFKAAQADGGKCWHGTVWEVEIRTGRIVPRPCNACAALA